MPSPKEKYASKVYLTFKEIGEREYQSIVRFFEAHEQDIQQLTFEEYFELLIVYTDSLFEIGAYSNYIDTCDLAIESTIYFNVKLFRGENIYQKLLFRKAASYYHLMLYPEAEHILQELIRINPDNKMAIRFLKKCKVSEIPRLVQKTRGISVVLFFLSALVIAVELLYIKSLEPEYMGTVRLSRNIIFGIGLTILLTGDALMRYRVNKAINQQAKKIRKGKTSFSNESK